MIIILSLFGARASRTGIVSPRLHISCEDQTSPIFRFPFVLRATRETFPRMTVKDPDVGGEAATCVTAQVRTVSRKWTQKGSFAMVAARAA